MEYLMFFQQISTFCFYLDRNPMYDFFFLGTYLFRFLPSRSTHFVKSPKTLLFINIQLRFTHLPYKAFA